MKFETTDVPFHVFRVVRSHLLKRGFNVSQRKLMNTIMELIAKNEKEMLQMLKEKKDYEVQVKNWLESSVETELTDALEEHDLVV